MSYKLFVFFQTLMGQSKKGKKNLKIFHPFIFVFYISLSSVSLSDTIYRLSRYTIIVQSRPSWKVVAEDGGRRRASGAFFATKGAARRRDQKHFLVGRIMCNKRECGLSFETGERFIINDRLVDQV